MTDNCLGLGVTANIPPRPISSEHQSSFVSGSLRSFERPVNKFLGWDESLSRDDNVSEMARKRAESSVI